MSNEVSSKSTETKPSPPAVPPEVEVAVKPPAVKPPAGNKPEAGKPTTGKPTTGKPTTGKPAVAKAKPAVAKAKSPANKSSRAAVVLPKLDEGDLPKQTAFKEWLDSSPSWLLSLIVHFVIILGLALWSLPELPQITANLLTARPSDNEDLDDFEDAPLVDFDQVELDTEPVDFEMQPDTELIAEQVSFSTFDEATAAPTFTELSDVGMASALSLMPTDSPGFDGTGTSGRGRMARAAMVRKSGGTHASETAVAMALEWLANHQNPDGSWSLMHSVGACNGRCANPAMAKETPIPAVESLRSGTGLALLPFLGAGQTHKTGKHKKVVERGLRALMQMGKAEKAGASWMDSGRMYSHGIAAIALTEAYGMTKDKELRAPAQAAVDFIVYAQHPKGGWRYAPGDIGDTSVSGWQVMALKSAYLSKLSVPPVAVRAANSYFDRAQEKDAARFTYLEQGAEKNHGPSNTLNAIGLLCRMYLGWKSENPVLKQGVAQLGKAGPSRNDYYYNYYGSQVLFQHTGGDGEVWQKWNDKLRDQLVDQQAKSGHAKGSWYVGGPHTERGGRLYMTALAAMNLEVYYRYMPIYQTEAVTDEFPE